MARKIIQVPVEEELLDALNRVSKKQRKARAVVIRQACFNYLRQIEDEELDRLYRQGYKKVPEEAGIGEVQIALAGKVLPEETW